MREAFKIGAVAIGPAGRDPASVVAEAEAGIRAAGAAGAGLVVLPEMFAAPYAAAEHPAEWPPLPERGLADWAARLAGATGTAILYGAAVASDGRRPYNAAVLARPDGRIEVVARKIHLPPAESGRFGEADHFAPGPPRIETFAVGPVRVAALVCYDRRFPECWRAAAAAGAQAVAVLVAGPAPEDPPGFFEAELAVHARSNAVYAVAAARYGTETATGRPVRHDGRTIIVDPFALPVAAVPAGGPGFVLAAVDLDRAAQARADNPTANKLRLVRTPNDKEMISWEN